MIKKWKRQPKESRKCDKKRYKTWKLTRHTVESYAQNHGNKAKLLFTNTDSWTCEIEADDMYKDFWKNKDKFYNSDYSENSRYFDKTNKKVTGTFKDETAGKPIIEFIALRSKIYSYIKDDQKVEKTAKGIKKMW